MKHALSFALSTLIITPLAFANKGAAYSPSHDNLDWSQNWYIGAGINTDTSFSLQGQTQAFYLVETQELELNNTSVGFDVYLGRAINEHFATEIGYTFVGNVDFDLDTVTTGVDHFTAKVEQWNFHGAALGRWPIGEYFNLLIKGGAGWYANTQNIENETTGAKVHDKYTGFALLYGGGFEVFWDQFGVRMDYTVVQPTDQVQDMFYISNLVGVSFIYKFM